MDFCEVEVDVCSNGTFGADCDNYCHCDSEVCDYVSGVCPGGVCLPGWATETCETACEFGRYGANCSHNCPNRNCKGDNSSCDHVTGECVGGCLTGWNGTDCTQKCLHSYGDGCSKRCSERKCNETSQDNCDHVTGECDRGCIPGWKDTDCTEACIHEVEYGSGCVGNCSTRTCEGENDTCPRDTGRCESGCQPGWKGEDCTQVCSFGTFGVNCTGVCGQCLDLNACHHDNGTCLTGCSDGWTNHACTEKLVEVPPTDAGVIAGSLATVIVAAAIVIVAVAIVRRRRRDNKKSQNHSSMVQIQTEDNQETGVDNPVAVLGEDEGDVEEDLSATYYNMGSAPAVTVVSVDQLGERMKELQVPAGGFQAEYQKLPTAFTKSYKHSQQPENKGKNKYISYYPYDATRVLLKELPDQPGSDYINASFIDGYSRPKAYIAAQAPNKMTLNDFWRMIWEYNCTRIVILTNLMEMGKVKCQAYWSDTSDIRTDSFTVAVTNISKRAHWVVRELHVTQKETNTTRCFHHFHFTMWPDHGTPEETAFTEFLWLVRTSYNTKDDHLLVHCSAGVGRTGTYIAVDYLLDQALAEDRVNVFGCVSRMRDQRKGMVQTKEQYKCVYIALYEALEYGNTAMDVEEFSGIRNVKKVFSMGCMTIPKFIQILNSQRKTQPKAGTSVKGRVWINGRSDVLAVMTPSHLSMNGYLLTEAPSVTTASLFWKLTEEQESSTVVVLPHSHQRLSSFVPSEGDSLDLSPVNVRCSTENTINPDIVLRKIHRQIEHSTPTLVHVYILKKSPQESSETVLSLLDQIAVHSSDHSATNPVTIVYQDHRQASVVLCILNNIVQGLKHDKRAEIYNNMRTMTHCLDQDITQADVALCYDVAAAYLESQTIYTNM
ncbi:receptor-type tyrosine-protein phosphatase alpha-like isoform X1 [Haliotis rufescens]|uniref:receptor-type tyrosine-protein phosphatase alpha-like isoform X1 n=1 Tax=Haliotis rufescens TaxID=6454 RepID=UPI00201F19B5|nr:receptor-type tyrosine-protein phosphatase alpha-like isoform X1 [Haliotis rufescens]